MSKYLVVKMTNTTHQDGGRCHEVTGVFTCAESDHLAYAEAVSPLLDSYDEAMCAYDKAMKDCLHKVKSEFDAGIERDWEIMEWSPGGIVVAFVGDSYDAPEENMFELYAFDIVEIK